MRHLSNLRHLPISARRRNLMGAVLSLGLAASSVAAGEPCVLSGLQSVAGLGGRFDSRRSCAPVLQARGNQHDSPLVTPSAFAPRELYMSPGMAYYDRPYGPDGLSIRTGGRAELPEDAGRSAYGTEVFRRAAERVQSSLPVDATYGVPSDTLTTSTSADGFLEYYDWRRHRDARLRWEQQHGEAIPAPVVNRSNSAP